MPIYLRTIVGAAFAARLEVSLWQVRDHIAVHVRTPGEDAWRWFDPVARDSDALELYTRISQRCPAHMGMHKSQVTCSFDLMRATTYAKDFHNDMGAALRGAVTNAAMRLYKYEHAHNLI